MTIKLLVWVLLNYSLVQIIAESRIFSAVRRLTYIKETYLVHDAVTGTDKKISEKKPTWLTHLIKCHTCLGVYSGAFFSVILWSPTTNIYMTNIIPDPYNAWMLFAFLDGLLASVTVTFINQVDVRWGGNGDID